MVSNYKTKYKQLLKQFYKLGRDYLEENFI